MSAARRGAWEPVAAGIGCLVLAAAVAWYVLEELEPPRAPVPGMTGTPFQALAANMPELGRFEDFYINNDNPFVPWRVREAEAKRLSEPKTVALKPKPPAQIKPIEPPKMNLPAKAAGGGDAPKVLGFQNRKNQPSMVVVQIPGEAGARTMQVGDKAGRWTFTGIEAGNIANFTDGEGRKYAIVIGGK